MLVLRKFTHTEKTGASVILSEYLLRLFNRQEQHVRMRVRSSGVIDLHSSSPLEQKKKK